MSDHFEREVPISYVITPIHDKTSEKTLLAGYKHAVDVLAKYCEKHADYMHYLGLYSYTDDVEKMTRQRYRCLDHLDKFGWSNCVFCHSLFQQDDSEYLNICSRCDNHG